jgi:hypothetical protein
LIATSLSPCGVAVTLDFKSTKNMKIL